MPQHDTDPGILEDRCYMMALEYVGTTYGTSAEEFVYLSPLGLSLIREETRVLLLEEFPDIEGPRISELMDEALTHLGFPHWRAS